jgi:hypothetical protein
VLNRYASAYNNRDIDAFGQLLAEDYVVTDQDSGGLRSVPMDKKKALELVGALFDAPNVTGLTFEFTVIPHPKPGETPGSWSYSGLGFRLVMEGVPENGDPTAMPVELKGTMNLHLRRAADGAEGFVIYAEEQL